MVPHVDLRSDGLPMAGAAAGISRTVGGAHEALTREDIRDSIRRELRIFATEQLNDMSKLLREGLRGLQQSSDDKISTSWCPDLGTNMVRAPTPVRPMAPEEAGPSLMPPGAVEECYETEAFSSIAHKPEADKLDSYSEASSADFVVATKSGKKMICSNPDQHQEKLSLSLKSSRASRKGFTLSGSKAFESMSFRQWSLIIVNHTAFDYIVAVFILLNGVAVGSQTDYMARNKTDEQPLAFQVVEMIFCIIFTAELSIRLYAFRRRFFTTPGARGWNWFDFLVVTLQLIEIFMSAVASGIGMSFNLLRTLRLIRVIRLARTLRLIGELRTIVSSIAGSMKPLFWTGTLLFMVVYVLGVYVTQVVLHKRISLRDSPEMFPEDLDLYWGDLIRSVFSLFESIAGGVDWDTVARPLIVHIGPEMGILFCLYITFTCFAMLNVVTGVFIQSVMENQATDTAFNTRNHVTSLFHSLDVDCDGELSWEEFECHLERQEMQEFFRLIDVDIANARDLFDLLDSDGGGTVDGNEFVNGCLKIWEPSQGLHQLMILSDLSNLKSLVETMGDDAKQRKDVKQKEKGWRPVKHPSDPAL